MPVSAIRMDSYSISRCQCLHSVAPPEETLPRKTIRTKSADSTDPVGVMIRNLDRSNYFPRYNSVIIQSHWLKFSSYLRGMISSFFSSGRYLGKAPKMVTLLPISS